MITVKFRKFFLKSRNTLAERKNRAVARYFILQRWELKLGRLTGLSKVTWDNTLAFLSQNVWGVCHMSSLSRALGYSYKWVLIRDMSGSVRARTPALPSPTALYHSPLGGTSGLASEDQHSGR